MNAKKNILSFYAFCICFSTLAQNLVPNPSFEIFSLCPSVSPQINNATGWSSYRETPDYYNSCDTSTFRSVPQNWAGFQYASIGDAYAGFFTYSSIVLYREYLGAQLINPLVVGQRYYVNIKVSLTNSSGALCATNNIGALFSTIQYNTSSPTPVSNFAHVFNSTPIQDTTNWTTISGSFIADSAYQYIIIGNFFDDANTTFIKMNSSNNCYSYYYVDDICVSTDSIVCSTGTAIIENKNIAENISVFPNPTSGNATITYTLPQGETQGKIIIYDTQGKEVKRFNVDRTFDSLVISTENLQSGLYYYNLQTTQGISAAKKLIIIK